MAWQGNKFYLDITAQISIGARAQGGGFNGDLGDLESNDSSNAGTEPLDLFAPPFDQSVVGG